MVKTAGPRNYVVWRNARVARRALYGSLFCPTRISSSPDEERNIAIVRDVATVEFRALGAFSDDGILELLVVVLGALFPQRAIDEGRPFRILHMMDAKT